MADFDLAAFQQQVLHDPIVRNVWEQKYRFRDEPDIEATRERVVRGVYAKDPSQEALHDALKAVLSGHFSPAGRVLAGAGTGRMVTTNNCYVGETIQDNMPGIQRAITNAALTMQQGGGHGTDFSTIRPNGAIVGRTGSISSGVIPFMDQQNAMCGTIMSAGTRRGAMMGCLSIDHPDVWNEDQFETTTNFAGETILRNPSFISAKRQKGRLTNFNVSVLISSDFMNAVAADASWTLGFHVPPAEFSTDCYSSQDKPFPYDYYEIDNEGNQSPEPTIRKGEMRPWYVYRRVPARRIWEDLMHSTYVYAEPGVLFIDEINRRNNLSYCEEIRATNPCGEQPLPQHGTCCLGSVNMALMVKNPFTAEAHFDLSAYRQAIKVGVRFLDNVLETANFPLKAQAQESIDKRRIGLGITGLGDALLQLSMRYGSPDAIAFSREMATILQDESYKTSIFLGKERGSFRLFNLEKHLNSPNLSSKSKHSLEAIGAMRNGVLNTIAPNGTISLYLGNVSSGVEPVFSFAKSKRRVRQPDGGFKEYDVVDYGQRLYEAMFPGEPLPEYFVGAMDVTPSEHVAMQAAWQERIDSSISKTINCPTSMTYEDFKHVYLEAYEKGCKGCTTYRYDPAAGRGFVLAEAEKEPAEEQELIVEDVVPAEITDEIDAWDAELKQQQIAPRPEILEGRTYKVRWPVGGREGHTNLYVNVTRIGNVPMEVFITAKEAQHQEWITALSRMITGIFRRGGDVRFVIHDLMEVHSATGGAWVDQKYRPSIVAAIGGVIEKEFQALGILASDGVPVVQEHYEGEPIAEVEERYEGEQCPVCLAPSYIRESGCGICRSCGYTNCG